MKIYIIIAVIVVPLFLGLLRYSGEKWLESYTERVRQEAFSEAKAAQEALSAEEKVILKDEGARDIVRQILRRVISTGEVQIILTDGVYVLIEKPTEDE